MGYNLTYRTCQPLGPEQESAIRSAADTFNEGRTWVLTLRRNERDGHLICSMEPNDKPDDIPPQWPGAYEAKCLLDGLCGISRDCKVDWEIHATHGLRPVGIIRDGECHADQEAQVEAGRRMVAARLGESGR